MGNHLFVIFAVLDVSLAVNLCINCSFFYIYSNVRACVCAGVGPLHNCTSFFSEVNDDRHVVTVLE